MAVWGSLFIQSPKAALKLEPSYPTIGFVVGFPRRPCGAHWLNPMKWLYAVVLLPYIIPVFVIQNIDKITGCCVGVNSCVSCGPCKACWVCIQWLFCCGPCKWIFMCGPCTCFCHFVTAACCFCRGIVLLLVSTLATMFTLALVPYPRTHMLFWIEYLLKLYPLIGLLWIQLWAYVCVVLFTTLYAILICGLEKLWTGIEEAGFLEELEVTRGRSTSRQNLFFAETNQNRNTFEGKGSEDFVVAAKTYELCFQMPQPISFPEHKRKALSALDPAYEQDFSDAELFHPDHLQHEFKAERIAVVGKTLAHQVNITILQLSCIILLRLQVVILTCPPNTNWFNVDFLINNVYLKTITERKLGLYWNTMTTAAHHAESTWQWQLFMHYLWKFI